MNLKRYMIHEQRFLSDLCAQILSPAICLLHCYSLYYIVMPDLEELDPRNLCLEVFYIDPCKTHINIEPIIALSRLPGTKVNGTDKQKYAPFSKHLLEHISTPNKDIRMILRADAENVTEESQFKHRPLFTSSVATDQTITLCIEVPGKRNNFEGDSFILCTTFDKTSSVR